MIYIQVRGSDDMESISVQLEVSVRIMLYSNMLSSRSVNIN